MAMKDRVEELRQRKAAGEAMGGPERLKRQQSKGKLDARSRVKQLFDPDSFEELGRLARREGKLPEEDDPARPSPADGVITGIGEIDGRPVAAAVYDFTVLGGSIGGDRERKVSRLRSLGLKVSHTKEWHGAYVGGLLR